MMLLSLVLSFLGFSHLAMSITRHYYDALKRSPLSTEVVLFRAIGWGFLLLSIWPCLRIWPTGIALTAWVGGLAISSFLVLTSLSYCRQFFMQFWRALCPGAWTSHFIIPRETP